ncbi:polysaccharide pyruvyl transferase family protein [Donghicola sp. XS_ASV15]|uniref:polysaccharide pyruvyl transferase family protein n=1 Tax=Donghicola sp. XS_ASV15 TaxID=3241295 RepID=UPI003512DB3B
MFSDASYEIFDDAKRVWFGEVSDEHLEGRDCIVLAAANWLSQDSEWRPALVDWLDRTNLPIIALGLGAQADMNGRIPSLRPSTRKLVSILAERSPAIAARGTFSCEVLAHYGAKNAVPTGCPSLLLNRAKRFNFDQRSGPSILKSSDIAVHGTRHHYKNATEFHAKFYDVAMSREYDVVLQSELADMYFALGVKNRDFDDLKAKECLEKTYGSKYELIQRYLKDHGKVFFSVGEWLRFCSTKEFVFGTRIHGTIASLLAGTPGALIAHDSRTKELGEAMGIFFVEARDFDAENMPVDELYTRCLSHDFNQKHLEYLDRYSEFFQKASLETNVFKLCA